MSRVVIAIPCHRDEPGVVTTARALAADAEQFPACRVAVCVNGPGAATAPAATSLGALGDSVESIPLEVVTDDRASKPIAWNLLRSLAGDADVVVFADADVLIDRGSVPALVDAIERGAHLAAASQRPRPAQSMAGRVASVPFRLAFGGLPGTLYAARVSALPEAMPEVLLDDAWLFATIGEQNTVRVPEAVAWFNPPESWRDLWRQRRRAEAGKRQLRALGVPLAASPPGLSPTGVLRAYRLRELPMVAALAAVKAAAALAARIRPAQWGTAPSTKR